MGVWFLLPSFLIATHSRPAPMLASNFGRLDFAGQNRALLPDLRAHLLGRVSYVEAVCPARGGRLRKLFEQIEWRDGDAPEDIRKDL